MYRHFKQHFESTINETRDSGLYKSERVIDSPQDGKLLRGRGPHLAGDRTPLFLF
jgi:hypothetical protein